MCDGFYDNGYGSAAWCSDGYGSVARGVNLVPIVSDTLDNTWCELTGIYTILRIVERMFDFFGIQSAAIEIGCDFEGGLKRMLWNFDQTQLYYVNGSHLDLINDINNICRTSIVKIIGQHIPSHQNDSCLYEHLDWWGQGNVDMDYLAKSPMFDRRRRKKE